MMISEMDEDKISIHDDQNDAECIRKLELATKEWDEVQEVVPNFASELQSTELYEPSLHNLKESPLISVDQIIQDFEKQDLTIQKQEAKVMLFLKFIKYTSKHYTSWVLDI